MRARRALSPRTRATPAPNAGPKGGYRVYVSTETEDESWDAFVARTGSRHTQSALWGQARALLGWRTIRVVAVYDGQIAGGVQMLLKRLPIGGGSIGHVPGGPILAFNDPSLTRAILDQLLRVAAACRVRYLVVRPTRDEGSAVSLLQGLGFRRSLLNIEVEPEATTLLDLDISLDEIMARMDPKTRYNIRLGQRKGVTVREGTETDLRTFYGLLLSTGRRQGFGTYPEEYFLKLWKILAPRGHAKLFLTEYRGEVLSSMLAIPFGSTVTYWRGAWSGRHGNRHPNEVMHWAAIAWAKANGYRYYDFEGIDPRVASAAVRAKPATDPHERSVSTFKLGFGGQVVVFPGVYEFIPDSLLRWAYRAFMPGLSGSPLLSKAISLVRGIRVGS